MTGGETYNYAAILLLLLAKQRSVPQIVYYDIACRFEPWLRKLLPDLPLGGAPEERPHVEAALSAMQMAVGDFHVQMHNAACQAAWSFRSCVDRTRFKDCMAAAGEPTEQFWANFGGGSLLRLKYMSLDNFTLVLESLFQTVNRANDARVASWLVERTRTLLAELRRIDTALASIKALCGARSRVRRPSAAALAPGACSVPRVCLDESFPVRVQADGGASVARPGPKRVVMRPELELVLARCLLHLLRERKAPLPVDLAWPAARTAAGTDKAIEALVSDVKRLSKLVPNDSAAQPSVPMETDGFALLTRELCAAKVRAAYGERLRARASSAPEQRLTYSLCAQAQSALDGALDAARRRAATKLSLGRRGTRPARGTDGTKKAGKSKQRQTECVQRNMQLLCDWCAHGQRVKGRCGPEQTEHGLLDHADVVAAMAARGTSADSLTRGLLAEGAVPVCCACRGRAACVSCQHVSARACPARRLSAQRGAAGPEDGPWTFEGKLPWASHAETAAYVLEPERERLMRRRAQVIGELDYRWHHERLALELERRERMENLLAAAERVRALPGEADKAFVFAARAHGLRDRIRLDAATFAKASLDARVHAALGDEAREAAAAPATEDGRSDAGADEADASSDVGSCSDCSSAAEPEERRLQIAERQARRGVVPESLMERLTLEDEPDTARAELELREARLAGSPAAWQEDAGQPLCGRDDAAPVTTFQVRTGPLWTLRAKQWRILLSEEWVDDELLDYHAALLQVCVTRQRA